MKSRNSIKQEREHRGWSQARLAQELGTDSVTISRWERGVSHPSPYFREKISHLFEKTVAELGLRTPVEEHHEDVVPDVIPHEQELFQPLEERKLACLSYVLGWLTGLLLLRFGARSRFIRLHALRSIITFATANLLFLALVLTHWLVNVHLDQERETFVQQGVRTVSMQHRILINDFIRSHMFERHLVNVLSIAQWVLIIGIFLFWLASLWIAAHGYTGILQWLLSSRQTNLNASVSNPSPA